MNINDYLKLYLSPNSPRYTAWKPVDFNDKERTFTSKDPLEYHATEKSNRWDYKLQQKFAFASRNTGDNVGFWRLMIGACYQQQNDSLFVVQDVIPTHGSQIIKYFRVLKF